MCGQVNELYEYVHMNPLPLLPTFSTKPLPSPFPSHVCTIHACIHNLHVCTLGVVIEWMYVYGCIHFMHVLCECLLSVVVCVCVCACVCEHSTVCVCVCVCVCVLRVHVSTVYK